MVPAIRGFTAVFHTHGANAFQDHGATLNRRGEIDEHAKALRSNMCLSTCQNYQLSVVKWPFEAGSLKSMESNNTL